MPGMPPQVADNADPAVHNCRPHFDIDDLLADKELQEDAYQGHRTFLHVLVLDLFA